MAKRVIRKCFHFKIYLRISHGIYPVINAEINAFYLVSAMVPCRLAGHLVFGLSVGQLVGLLLPG